MKLLRELGSLLKATGIYFGWVREDIQRGDLRFASTSPAIRTNLEHERTTYRTVFGPNSIPVDAFKGPWGVDVEAQLVGFAWRLGTAGYEEFAAVDYSVGLFKMICMAGDGLVQFERSKYPMVRAFYRGHMDQHDQRLMREFSPVFSSRLYALGIGIREEIPVLTVAKILESYA